mmetsp:Transcript_5332/g.17849  ORF Transcript_5332/g.17849 Transcript_5332/m.17849 type:complete len:265 (+) Transcript_5332:26-820(+)
MTDRPPSSTHRGAGGPSASLRLLSPPPGRRGQRRRVPATAPGRAPPLDSAVGPRLRGRLIVGGGRLAAAWLRQEAPAAECVGKGHQLCVGRLAVAERRRDAEREAVEAEVNQVGVLAEGERSGDALVRRAVEGRDEEGVAPVRVRGEAGRALVHVSERGEDAAEQLSVRERGVERHAAALRGASDGDARVVAAERGRLGVDGGVDPLARPRHLLLVDLLLEVGPPFVAAVVGEVIVPRRVARPLVAVARDGANGRVQKDELEGV